MHGYENGGYFFLVGIGLLLSTKYFWWRDVVREGTIEGQHTSLVQLGLRFGMVLFIVSEVMFFFAFFWAFFWSSMAPVPEIASVWPPQSIDVLSAWEVPLLNTVILLSSGATVTWAHHAVLAGDHRAVILGLLATVGLAIAFTALQGFEYVNANFTIADSVFGSTFFMATGFHGFHVFIGTCFLVVCLFRALS
jgi:cytochrome c oxidase subunit 3